MKRLAYIVAALGALVIAAPSIASAETVIIKKRGYHHHHHPHHGARAEFRRDRGWHRGWRHGHRDRTVVIKKYRY
ncbi:hypothetical protein CQ12_01025 [Bradyrhizobium jicamae]|uniref:Uncharacterized protein n=1 Tax=Bradyrhizobium jicamae TaxID=280332 RepID=A0A0R3LI11_9BRAD|nr:hypothetical protein [Bradyrhizobium jicamae]KRR07396.1 hypothetical protein CQ12_01025 [Bradyrhizobium jicamae]